MANPWERYGGGEGVQIKPADPSIADKQTITRNQAAASGFDPAKAALENQAAQLRIQQIQQQMAADAQKAAQDAAVNKDLDARNSKIATLNALSDQLVRVEQLYNKSFRGGFPNWLAGRTQPAQAEALDKAASGLLDAGQAVFRIPGSGDLNPQEVQFKLDAYKPSATGTDAGNTETFNYLRGRINAELKSLGQPEIDFDARINPKQPEAPQDSVLNPLPGRSATKSETAALEPGQRFAYDEAGKPIGILDAQGNWVSGYGEIVGGNQDERDDAARDTLGGNVDAFVRGAVDWPTLGNANKISAGLNALLDRRGGESLGDAYWRNMDLENRKDAADERINPWARFGGQLSGALLGEYGAARSAPRLFGGGELPAFSGRGIAIDAGAGAGYSASKAFDTGGDPLSAAAEGGIYSVLGGIGGRGAANLGGRVISGVTNPQVKRLMDADVPMTLPQMVSQSDLGIFPFGPKAGAVVKGFEDVAEGLGPLGAGIKDLRTEGIEGFNRAAFREAGFDGADISEAGIDAAKAVRQKAYNDALAGKTVAADLPFIRNMNAIAKASDQIKGMEGMFRDTLADRVGRQFDKATRTMSGRDMQAAIRGLKADAKKADASNLYMRSDQFGDAAKKAEDELMALADRQNPGMSASLLDANRMYMASEILRGAVRKGENQDGIFTPAQLGQASSQAAEKFGKNAGTTARPFHELQRAGQNILPSKLPDSGTFGRGAATVAPYLIAGGAQTGIVPGFDTGSAEANALAAAALLMSGAGQKVAKKALTGRGATARGIGKSVRRNSGLFGASVAPLPILISE